MSECRRGRPPSSIACSSCRSTPSRGSHAALPKQPQVRGRRPGFLASRLQENNSEDATPAATPEQPPPPTSAERQLPQQTRKAAALSACPRPRSSPSATTAAPRRAKPHLRSSTTPSASHNATKTRCHRRPGAREREQPGESRAPPPPSLEARGLADAPSGSGGAGEEEGSLDAAAARVPPGRHPHPAPLCSISCRDS